MKHQQTQYSLILHNQNPNEGILSVQSTTDIDQYNDKVIETTPEMRIADQTVNVEYSRSKLQESEGTRLNQPGFKVYLVHK